jgi:DNA-binding transcriptional regulator GbsR (MarR family)
MDRITAIFVDGLGTAADSSGVLSRLQGRIFALLYLHEGPLSLDDIAEELEQSKSNVSINIRGLIEWHLVRRLRVAGSRRDHYEAATDFFRVVREIMERRFRWCVRLVLATLAEAERALGEAPGAKKTPSFVAMRLGALRAFFTLVDTGFGAFAEGRPLDPTILMNVRALPPTGGGTPPTAGRTRWKRHS